MPTNRTRKSRKRTTLPPYLEKWIYQIPGRLTGVEVCDLFLYEGDMEAARKLWAEYNPGKPFVSPMAYADAQEEESADQQNETIKK